MAVVLIWVAVVVKGAEAVGRVVGGNLAIKHARAGGAAHCQRIAALLACLAAEGVVEVGEEGVDAVLARVDVGGHVEWLVQRNPPVRGARGPLWRVSSSIRSEP